jgi:SAM-dependent methyltransferase
MSGFSADWLALREDADHAARNRELLETFAASFAGREHVRVLDLACGAGSNLRGQALYLPPRQSWRLVDHDPRLLDAARAKLIAWADRVEAEAPLTLQKADRRLEIAFLRSDLSRFNSTFLASDLDLVTAAAFFDLVSAAWITQFCEALAKQRLPLYAVLTYDGNERWSPAHEADVAVLAAYRAHQSRDKGFGPAAGPRAPALLRDALERRGYCVETASSPWRLGPAQAELARALAEGSAQAVAETGLVAAEILSAWRASRRIATTAEIGHADLFASF